MCLFGHAMDQSYLYLRIYENSVEGTVEMTYKDLNKALGLNLQRGMKLDDLEPYLPIIQAYFKEKITLSKGDTPYEMVFIEPQLMSAKMGVFLRSHFELPSMNPIPETIDIDYNILFDRDPDHQGFLVIGHHWKSGIIKNEGIPSLLFSDKRRRDVLELKDASIMTGFYKLVRLGAYHIWVGLDHILFLLALLLPAVVHRKQQENGLYKWEAVSDFKSAFWYIIKIVTFFTIAHSITLSLAALGYINLSSRVVESIIAISIALAAYHNIKPIFGQKEWLIAFGFGLFHGMGFASVLGEKGLNGEYMVLSLFGFNLGVELGQIFIICLIFPVLYFLRKKDIYKHILYYGSILLILISIYWFIERSFDVNFLLDDYVEKAIRKLKRII